MHWVRAIRFHPSPLRVTRVVRRNNGTSRASVPECSSHSSSESPSRDSERAFTLFIIKFAVVRLKFWEYRRQNTEGVFRSDREIYCFEKNWICKPEENAVQLPVAPSVFWILSSVFWLVPDDSGLIKKAPLLTEGLFHNLGYPCRVWVI